jgi:hypothetical protein
VKGGLGEPGSTQESAAGFRRRLGEPGSTQESAAGFTRRLGEPGSTQESAAGLKRQRAAAEPPPILFCEGRPRFVAALSRPLGVWPFDQRDGVRGDGTALANGVETFVALGLDAHACDIDAQRRGNCLPHGGDPRRESR